MKRTAGQATADAVRAEAEALLAELNAAPPKATRRRAVPLQSERYPNARTVTKERFPTRRPAA